MTLDIDREYGVTIHPPRSIGQHRYRAEANIFRRDDVSVDVQQLYGEGAHPTEAQNDAIKKAKAWVAEQAASRTRQPPLITPEQIGAAYELGAALGRNSGSKAVVTRHIATGGQGEAPPSAVRDPRGVAPPSGAVSATRPPEPVRPIDVTLSFAGEDRDKSEAIAERCRARGISVFYDRYETANLWGKDLYQHLADVYANKARFCVVIVSRHYAAKLWTNHELQSAQTRAFQEKSEYILPVRVDETELPGLPPTVGYIDWAAYTPDQIVDLLATKLGHPAAATADSRKAAPSRVSSISKLLASADGMPRSELADKVLAMGPPQEVLRELLACQEDVLVDAHPSRNQAQFFAFMNRLIGVVEVVAERAEEQHGLDSAPFFRAAVVQLVRRRLKKGPAFQERFEFVSAVLAREIELVVGAGKPSQDLVRLAVGTILKSDDSLSFLGDLLVLIENGSLPPLKPPSILF